MSDTVTLLQLVDDLAAEITMAKGIQAAIAGLKDVSVTSSHSPPPKRTR
jgi:hypothetical protein